MSSPWVVSFPPGSSSRAASLMATVPRSHAQPTAPTHVLQTGPASTGTGPLPSSGASVAGPGVVIRRTGPDPLGPPPEPNSTPPPGPAGMTMQPWDHGDVVDALSPVSLTRAQDLTAGTGGQRGVGPGPDPAPAGSSASATADQARPHTALRIPHGHFCGRGVGRVERRQSRDGWLSPNVRVTLTFLGPGHYRFQRHRSHLHRSLDLSVRPISDVGLGREGGASSYGHSSGAAATRAGDPRDRASSIGCFGVAIWRKSAVRYREPSFSWFSRTEWQNRV